MPKDITNQSKLLEILESLSESVSSRLKKKGYVTKNIAITIRYNDRKTISRGKKIINPIVEAEDIFQAAKNLFLLNWKGDPVRLLGITGQDLIDDDNAFEQLDLFSYEKAAQKEPLYNAIDKIKSKYGTTILQKGSDLQKGKNHK